MTPGERTRAYADRAQLYQLCQLYHAVKATDAGAIALDNRCSPLVIYDTSVG